MSRYAFHIGWHDSGSITVYALNEEHAERELKKLDYSTAPIRFLKLYAATGEKVFVNLSYVATVVFKEEDDDEVSA